MQRASLPYVVVGAVAAGERSSRAVASVGVRVAGVAMRPAGRLVALAAGRART
ncbi:MAG: hypothetical protein ACXVUL_09135 [Solirubrobacteraceae bacterium]